MSEPFSENRLVRIVVNPRRLLRMFQEGEEIHYKVQTGLPEGARFVRWLTGASMATADGEEEMQAVFCHESFKALESGDIIPLYEIGLLAMPCQPARKVISA